MAQVPILFRIKSGKFTNCLQKFSTKEKKLLTTAKKCNNIVNTENIKYFTELWVKIFKNFIGPYAGIPIKYAADVWEKTPEYLEDDKYLDVLKLWSGVSPYTIETKGKNKED